MNNIHESVEKKRTGSSQKQNNQLNSSILRVEPSSSKSNLLQKLHEDESLKKIIPPLILESAGTYNYQQKNRSNSRVCFYHF